MKRFPPQLADDAASIQPATDRAMKADAIRKIGGTPLPFGMVIISFDVLDRLIDARLRAVSELEKLRSVFSASHAADAAVSSARMSIPTFADDQSNANGQMP